MIRRRLIRTIPQEVERFLKQLNLYRSNVQAQIGGHQAKIVVELENWEIADSEFPALLRARFDGEKKKLQKNLDAIYAGAAQVFQESLQQGLARQLKQVMEDPARDSRARRDWASVLADHLTSSRDQTALEVVETTERVANLQRSCEAVLEAAVGYKYIPMFGDHRKGAALDCAEQASDLLNKTRELENLRREQRLYEDLLARLETLISTRVPQTAEIVEALTKTER